MALPDFLIVGAMKCGTSTLAAQLGAQDGVFMTTPKEPNFFSDDDIYARGLCWYESLFERAASDDLKGEASTHYTKLPTFPETVARMHAVLDTPKLVYVVRDPIERALSHIVHEWTERRMGRDPTAAFARHPELIEYGLFAKQITPFIEAYGRDAVCLTSLERLKVDPQGELERVAAHIGMTRKPLWRNDLEPQNVSGERFRKLPFHSLLVNNPVAEAVRRSLVPRGLRTRVRQARQYGKRPQLPGNLRKQLQERFAEDQAELRRMFPGVLELTDRQWQENTT